MSELLGHEKYIFPVAEDEFARDKALSFWQQMEPDDISSSLANEMLSTFSQVKLDINMMLAEPGKNQIILFSGKNSFC